MGNETIMSFSVDRVLVLNMPATVSVVPYAVKFEPTFKLFLEAMLVLTIASFVSALPLINFPLLRVTVFPVSLFKFDGSLVPMILTGGVKLVGSVPPPFMKMCGPPESLLSLSVTGEVRLVWLLLLAFALSLPPRNEGWAEPIVVRRSVSVSLTLVTCAIDCTLDNSMLVNELLTLEKLLKPAGAIATVLPIELFTWDIF